MCGNFKKMLSGALLCIALASCTITRSFYDFEYLEPGHFSFAENMSRVAVLNNAPPSAMETNASVYYDKVINGNGNDATEALAQAVAETNYFDKVMVCDSAYFNESLGEGMLPQKTVQQIANDLDVDVVMSIEQVHLRFKEEALYDEMGDSYRVNECYLGSVVSIYTPQRSKPVVSFQKTDSLIYLGNFRAKSERLQMVRDASSNAGTLCVNYMLPHWKEATRHYYTGSMAFNDGAYFFRQGQLEEARDCWEKAYQTAKGMNKARLASNLAMVYEQLDDYATAIKYLDEALAIVGNDNDDAAHMALMREQVMQRENQAGMVAIQMKRFEQ